MLLVTIDTWDKCEKILEQLKPDTICFIIDSYNRAVTLRFTDGLVVYEYCSEPDDYPPCDIYVSKPETFSNDNELKEIEASILNEPIKYLVGCQKLNGVNLWCVYSNYAEIVRPIIERKLSNYGLPVEGLITEIRESLLS